MVSQTQCKSLVVLSFACLNTFTSQLIHITEILLYSIQFSSRSVNIQLRESFELGRRYVSHLNRSKLSELGRSHQADRVIKTVLIQVDSFPTSSDVNNHQSSSLPHSNSKPKFKKETQIICLRRRPKKSNQMFMYVRFRFRLDLDLDLGQVQIQVQVNLDLDLGQVQIQVQATFSLG